MKIRAAVDARRESGSDIVIVARTDARQAVSLEEALTRCKAYGDAGADVLFIDALASVQEMKALCQLSPHLPKLVCILNFNSCWLCYYGIIKEILNLFRQICLKEEAKRLYLVLKNLKTLVINLLFIQFP